MMHNGLFALPARIEDGLDWMIGQAYSENQSEAERGRCFLKNAGGAKAEKVVIALEH